MVGTMKKRASSSAFEESTSSWFIQGLDSQRMAELHPEEEARPTGWSAVVTRLTQLFRRN